MGDFFKSWRRKLGVATLMMACVFMGGWVRSVFIVDTLGQYFSKFASYEIRSRQQKLVWVRGTFPDPVLKPTMFPEWQATDFVKGRSDAMFIGDHPDIEQWRCLGFAFGDFRQNGTRCCWYSAPYWSIVLPLTLLSAYLLLSKPRKAKVEIVTEK